MATINGFTAEHMRAIQDGVIVSAAIVGNDLIFTKYDGSTLNVGDVRGPQGIQGPEGSVEEAPLTGDYYLRKDGEWDLIDLFLPAEDGLKYSFRDGAWVRADRPWKLTLNQDDTVVPTGFSATGFFAGANWYVRITGSGYNVNYNFEFSIDGGAVGSTARLTLPSSLYPITAHTGVAYIADTRSMRTGAGIVATRIDTNGQVKVPQRMQAVLTEVGASIGEPSVEVQEAGTALLVQMSGSYTRESINIPDVAVYIGS